jgi:branched-chain amino acid transport system permease protein
MTGGVPGSTSSSSVILSGGITAIGRRAVRPASLRIKGFYLAVATLAAQFFLVWLFNKVSWFYNYSASGQISAPSAGLRDQPVTGPATEPWAPISSASSFVIAWRDRAQPDARAWGANGWRSATWTSRPRSSG